MEMMVLWMFSTSVLLGTFVTGMTPLAYQWSHYTISWTRVCMAWYMASWMGVIEIAMSARMSAGWRSAHTRMLLWMGVSAVASLFLLRSQAFVSQDAWAARMVEHHSTALLTSNRLLERCANGALCDLAASIVTMQAAEIQVLRNESPVAVVTSLTALATLVVVLPAAAFAWKRMAPA